MGFARCSFNGETDCNQIGSKTYFVQLLDLNVILDVPEMWQHYLENHLVQPTQRERDLVMTANLESAQSTIFQTKSASSLEIVQVLYVGKTKEGYTHRVGTDVDRVFLTKIDELLSRTKPEQYRG